MNYEFLCVTTNFKEFLFSRQYWSSSGFSNDEYPEPVEVFDIFSRFKRLYFVRIKTGYRRLLLLVSTIFCCPVLDLNKIHLVNISHFFEVCRTFQLEFFKFILVIHWHVSYSSRIQYFFFDSIVLFSSLMARLISNFLLPL